MTSNTAPADTGTKLTFKLEREVKPTEIAYMVFGTGAGTYPWWHRFVIGKLIPIEGRFNQHKLLPIADVYENTTADCVLHIEVDNPEEPEGSGKTIAFNVTMQQVCDAVSRAWKHIGEESRRDMYEDLGLADAEAADLVLQFAIFPDNAPVYG
jgi:hypothetical protein